MLIPVGNNNRELSLLREWPARQAANTDNRRRVRVCSGEFGDEGHFSVVVNEAFADQSIVGNSRVELGHVKITQVHGFVRKETVELHHSGLIFRPDWPDGYFRLVLHGP